jgi:putative membrane-bound dehydrogenase-like protein
VKRAALGLSLLAASVLLSGFLSRGEEPPRTGPATEKRFPPLVVPPGFKATLFACDPLIEYPSVISVGPRPGAVFVGIDYMTGLGTEIVRRSEVRLIQDTDGDGYADKVTVFAKDFNSIQGLAYHDGTVYVMHAPFLTALRDTKGTGVADERRDLLTGLGLTPEQNPVRLHCANGVVVGHDGWLYLAMGDHGVDVPRPEGDRLVLRGGGILRCRPDGRDLHVFSSGLRNIYDVGLDAELNVLVRDNENDGGTYMIRVCHSFHGADHGYPYLYAERPDEAMPPIADLGLGSSAGVCCYLERQFPAEYRGNLFACEWGRSLVRYPLRRAGSSFETPKEIEFAAGAASDPYGFKPTDVVVQRDGTLMVSDYADGQRPKRGRGRIYHIEYVGERPAKTEFKGEGTSRWLAQLDSESYLDRWEAQAALERLGRDGRNAVLDAIGKDRIGPRGRLHVVWVLAHVGGGSAPEDLLHLASTDAEPTVRAQALRAVADLVDPVLTRHKLDAGPGDADLAARLATLTKGQDSRVVLEGIIALGRLRWAGLPEWLRANLTKPDAVLSHAAMQALRRSENWPAILKLLDEPAGAPIRTIALRAVAERFAPVLVDGLIARLKKEPDADRRREYADALTRVHQKPGAAPYWGYRPAPRPANTVAWDRTEAIGVALDTLLADPDRKVRQVVLQRMQREKVPVRLDSLLRWLRDERDSERTAAILSSLAEQPAAEVRMALEGLIRDRVHSTANRQAALALLAKGLPEVVPLRALAADLEDGPLLADVLARLVKAPGAPTVTLLTSKVGSPAAEVRAAAIAALGELKAPEGREAVTTLLQDRDVRVRRAAASAAGPLGAKVAIEQLLKLLADTDASVRRASLDSLTLLRETRAVPLAVAALGDRDVQLSALRCLAELGGPEQATAVAVLARTDPSAAVLAASVRVLTAWGERKDTPAAKRRELDDLIAGVHGSNGVLVRWHGTGSVPAAMAPRLIERVAGPTQEIDPAQWTSLLATGTEGRLSLAPRDPPKDTVWLACTEVSVTEATAIEVLTSSSGPLQVWLNGKSVYHREQGRNFQLDSDRFAASLDRGNNRLLVQVGSSPAGVEFHLRFRRKSASAEHERLTQAALTRSGNVERGRKVFHDVERSLCLKCHRLGDKGERIGPDLTGVGGRFSRIYLVESILQPSRTIAPSYGTLVLTLQSGKVLTGVKVAETETTLTVADNQGQKQEVRKADIEKQEPSPVSTMPEGLEKRITEDELVDLIAFLVSQKEARAP